MHITPVACLRDNYAYLVWQEGSREALVVDPSETAPVSQAADALGLRIAAILCTHHHVDHVGGVAGLVAERSMPVYGHASDKGRIPEQSEFLEHAAEVRPLGLAFRVLHIPGHTTGAVAYVGDNCVFTGDTLFIAGCGRLFEGTPKDMYTSLNVTLGALPDVTRVYCGHEYTLSNLKFAAHVEPNNDAVRAKATQVAELRAAGTPSVPSTLGEERATNPFMRCQSPEIRAHFGLAPDTDAVSVLAALRAAKDKF